MSEEREQYTMGYGQAATAIMAIRTAQNHAAFFLPYLEPGMNLLDCGCGPGTITLGFAKLIAPGQAVGTEIEASQVNLARENAAGHQVSNARFEVASIYELPFEDASFDAVFISAVLGNLQEPVRGLREAYRVLKPGGMIGVKEFDHGGDLVYPLETPLEMYGALYKRLRHEYGHDAEGGRKIGAYLLEAGFGDLRMSASYEVYADPNAVSGFARVSAGLLSEGWGDEFTSRGWATTEAIEEMSAAWGRFAAMPGAIFAAAWCEAVARKEATSVPGA
jgi:ubiquinone/menaquinone biosynthesis C-methylase UbiE